uniref:Uncharacterized protein n=1 Tax=Arundo donax TaxID=35708 RepID=A0A0A9BEF9_ARUDO
MYQSGKAEPPCRAAREENESEDTTTHHHHHHHHHQCDRPEQWRRSPTSSTAGATRKTAVGSRSTNPNPRVGYLHVHRIGEGGRPEQGGVAGSGKSAAKSRRAVTAHGGPRQRRRSSKRRQRRRSRR